MPTDTSIETRVAPLRAQDRAAPRPAGAGLILGMAIGTLIWGGLLALFLL